jgi:succinoglycan biosynthesis protein ExoM
MHKSEKIFICIAVCTRLRPIMLARLIDSYLSLHIPDSIRVCLVVMENNSKPEAEDLVRQKNILEEKPVYYYIESRLGIPIARNKCIDAAFSLGADFIAFVDDDEWLSEDWLQTMWSFCQKTQLGSVIQGPVISVMPLDAPKYMADFFQRKMHSTGTIIDVCATNNVLVPMAIILEHSLRFDESIPFAGGTDSKFFRMARSKGVRLVYCAESIVYEDIDSKRITFRWLSRRYFVTGLSIGAHRKTNSRVRFFGRFFLLAIRAAWQLVKSLFHTIVFNRRRSMECWLGVCRLTGEILGPFNVKIESYRAVDGC